MDRNDTNNSAATYTRFTGEELETGVYTLEDDDSVTIPNHGSRYRSRLMWCSNNRRILLAGFIIFLIFCFGFLAGYLVRRGVHCAVVACDGSGTERPTDGPTTTAATPTTDAIFKDIKGKMSPELMRQNRRTFGDRQHLAGSAWSSNMASVINDIWSGFGFETVLKNYTVTLSSPGKNILNITGLSSALPTTVYISAAGEFTPYSLDSSASGQPIFVNYGRYKDYQVLISNVRYNFKLHSIGLARLGKIPLSAMIRIAVQMNLKGMIIFADPTDYAPGVNYTPSMDKTKTSQVFPNTVWLPGDTVVMDTMISTMGDPFSPGFASGVQHGITLNQTTLSKIPVISIDYENAYKIISNMQGAAPPKDQYPDWTGSFGDYHIEGGSTQNINVDIDVDNKLEKKQITNVLSTIRGSVEPEQYVIIGGHRDSVSVGAASPGTGFVCLMEVARLLKFLMDNRKWKPYRSIMLVSWDAGATGQIGSTEWVEANQSLLRSSVVAYINLDDAVLGDYVFGASGSPLLSKVIYEASKNVKCPKHQDMSIYMDWKSKSKDLSVSIPGVGTDDSPFLHLVGVPTISPSYSYNKGNMRIDKYALYNTKLDTSTLVDKYDPDLDYHKAVIEVTLRVLYEIADKPVLPFSVDTYADVLLNGSSSLQSQYPNAGLDQLVTAATNFKTSARVFTALVDDTVSKADTNLYPSINHKLMSLEKMFLSKVPREYFEDYRHLVLGPTLQKAYDGTVFAPLSDALAYEKDHPSMGTDLSVGYTVEIVSSLMQASQLLSSNLP